ncbi:2-phospho-L-lactate guanylyltransferase [Amycolatopsis xylanica]|uniref:2-phospho-L-lactate guanylyltransferase n=1 Tax=Amycolatopsis xylanica TaxID=589385 RepID=UPI001FDF4538|nr:2-phospho-L-lactate guanylyltransferase [Amycolatopsis xylanica]
MAPTVDLVVPLKPPRDGKSRLRGALTSPGDDVHHAELVLALALDTLTAATAAPGVRRVLVVAADPEAIESVKSLSVEIVAEPGAGGLNAAYQYGESVLRAGDPNVIVGALQADLPALRAVDLGAAIALAGGRRAFSPDRQGTGTTFLISAPGLPLDPLFGVGSAGRHANSGALTLDARLSLRSDVDTADDLLEARLLGVGEHTKAILDRHCSPL